MEFVTNMSTPRANAASIAVNDTTLWVTGGVDHNWNILKSTEFATLHGSQPGPDLHYDIDHHAMVAINTSVSMIIGGDTTGVGGATATTFYYDHFKGIYYSSTSFPHINCAKDLLIVKKKP